MRSSNQQYARATALSSDCSVLQDALAPPLTTSRSSTPRRLSCMGTWRLIERCLEPTGAPFSAFESESLETGKVKILRYAVVLALAAEINCSPTAVPHNASSGLPCPSYWLATYTDCRSTCGQAQYESSHT